jgi:hypothetical protein
MTEADPENNYYLAKGSFVSAILPDSSELKTIEALWHGSDYLLWYIGVKEDDPEEALKKFREIVTADAAEPSKWSVLSITFVSGLSSFRTHRVPDPHD